MIADFGLPDFGAAGFLEALLSANIAGGAAILLVLLARGPVRRAAGARLAYWLWLTPLVAGFAGLLPAAPAKVIHIALLAASAPEPTAMPAALSNAAVTAPAALAVDPITVLVALWALGAVGCLALVLARQARTMRSFATRGMAGPAVVGVVRPRVIEPADFEQRFSARERELILAHERAHIGAGDTRINAILALLTCFNWFNPLVHLAARLARTDQELACDAAVVERFPGERRIYAEALLKTQLSPASLPLGCTWPTRSSNLLKERVMMLARKSPGRAARTAGVSLVALLAGGAGLAAWAAQPPRPPVYVVDQAPAVAPNPAPQQPAASSELPQDWRTHLKVMAHLLMAYRDRVIPLDQIIEASVTAELHNGERLGPYRMYSSLPNDFRSSEFANGDKGFNADGDDRFVGGLLGSVNADGGLTLDFGFVVDGEPITVERLKAQSGASVVVEKNGVKLTIHPELRPMTAAELKRRIPGRKGPVKAKLQQDKASPPDAAPQQGTPKTGPERPPTDPYLKAIDDYLNLKFDQSPISPDDRARMIREFEGQLRLRYDPKSPPPKPEDMERFASSFVWMTQPDGSTTIEQMTPELKAQVDAIIAARKAPKSRETAARLKALEKQLAADLGLNGKPDPYVQGYLDQMVMRMSSPPGVTFSAAQATDIAPNAPLTCDNWPSIWGGDPRANYKALKKTTPVVVTFDNGGLPSIDISAAAAAFPRDLYPAGLAEGEPTRSRMAKDFASYRVKSKTVMDTFTFGGLDTGRPSIMWHRVRITKDGPVDTLMEGHCRK